ncbi:glycoside hydrolase family 97 protein [Arachidicoccus soli]|uniref:Alpha-glucosidase n=1 Tax=Arachidicoccus soli TaxID=2341117 RepID=A0A386HPG1_9BACT|nr:glycoside hydrolase family 97 protein [Arachidicoccus soli]AYD47725.1 alpha-glucosidase [Arachidicoccus soli]
MNKISILNKTFLGLLCFFLLGNAKADSIHKSEKYKIQSPDKHLSIQFYQLENANGKRTMYYEVEFNNQLVIKPSVMDINMDNHLSEEAMALKVDKHKDWCENLKIINVAYSSLDTAWTPVCGEQDSIRDNYNAITIHLIKDDNPIYLMDVEIHAYNQGIAFRYFFPENSKGTYYNIISENTTFSLPANTKAWVANWAQAPYRLLPLKNWSDESERPLTLQLSNGLYMCLTEAAMTNYARTKFKLSATQPNTFETSMDGAAQLISPVATPWRVIMVANKPGELIENDNLILNLNPPNKIKNTSWINPGKMIRVMTQTTDEAKKYIDFAAQQGLQYILFDWKWYGPAFSFNSDATKVVAPLDMPEIIKYGESKGIGVWLYVNQQALLAQSDSLFRVYKQWGIKGVKFGFVQNGSHRWTTWLERAIRQAAQNDIMVDIHDDWRPTGEQCTWPNLMTAEGIRGNEEMPDATHNTILPFTRFIAGPADYTICYFDKRIKTTHAHQLALGVIYYSPIQTLYWYDNPSMYHGEKELQFWKEMPTTWDETKIIDGTPGEFIITARRKSDKWFIGAITNDNARTINIPLSFLATNVRYNATIYKDDKNLNTTTKVAIEEKTVNSQSVLKFNLEASGGVAIALKVVQ